MGIGVGFLLVFALLACMSCTFDNFFWVWEFDGFFFLSGSIFRETNSKGSEVDRGPGVSNFHVISAIFLGCSIGCWRYPGVFATFEVAYDSLEC